MQFVPLWTDILDKPNWKILDLPADLFRAWALCLIAAQKHDYVDGRLPDDRTLAHWIGTTREVLAKLLDQLVLAGLVDRDDDGHRMHDWDDWRLVKDPKDTQRKRKYRAERRAKEEAKQHGNGTCPEPVPSMSRPRPAIVLPQQATGNKQQATSSSGEFPPPPVSRSPEDQKQFDEAVSMLSRSLQTQPLSMDLNRRADLSEVAAVKGWQWIVAARVAGEGKAKKLNFSYLMGIARNATRDEFEDYARKPMGGKDAPAPKLYGAIQGP